MNFYVIYVFCDIFSKIYMLYGSCIWFIISENLIRFMCFYVIYVFLCDLCVPWVF